MTTNVPRPRSHRRQSRTGLALVSIAALALGLAAAACSGPPSGDPAAGDPAAAAGEMAATGSEGSETGNGLAGETTAAAPTAAVPTDAAATAARTWPDGSLVIGEPIQAGAPVKLAAVKADPTAYFEKTILVEATAAAVCQAKGCWMTVTDADGAGEPIWVRWSSGCGGQYAFPKDAAGRTIIVQGSFYEKEIDEAAAEHLAAENETIDKDAIVGKTFEMNATGCVLLPAEAKGA
jgi:hypothetical protein